MNAVEGGQAQWHEPWQIELLIVDDNAMDREWIASQARSMDEYQTSIRMAASVDQARALIEAQTFDVALIDYDLGNTYGDEVIKLLVARQSRCAPVLVSGHSMAEVSLYGVRAGAAAAISKDDLNPSLLETTIRFALAHTRRDRAANPDAHAESLR